MKAIIFLRSVLLATVLMVFPAYTIVPGKGRFVIGTDSRLLIHGLTNVNSFRCSVDCYSNQDTLEYNSRPESCELNFFPNRMRIPVRSFDCNNPLITKDFWQTLKADKFPDMEIRFLSLEKLNTSGQVSGKVQITLAGISKEFTVNYSVEDAPKNIRLVGKQNVCFSDFELQAPQKMMGLIQVKENLEVEFHISLQPI